jgi:glycosyltransferase involved in cell wall biosynthesis
VSFTLPHFDRLTTVVEVIGVGEQRDMGDPPLISVVVPVLNGMPWIEHQLLALSTQEVPAGWEVVVADNGSRDGTRSAVERWSERCPRIRLVDSSARAGAGAARNIGVRWARGRMLAFCDADDVVQPGWLASLVAALGHADLIAGVFDFVLLNGQPGSDPVPAASRQMGFLPFALGANLAVRRDAFEAVHGFCETIPPSEDTDLSWRLQLAGYRFGMSADALVAKREHASGLPTFRAAWAYGKCAPQLYRHYRDDGMSRDLRGAAKAWIWLIGASPGLVRPSRRHQWVRAFGIRAGRLVGSVTHHAFFP